MKLKKITIKDFKLLRDITLDFQDKSTILFGVNGTGKSTVLEAINYLFQVWIRQLNSSQSKFYDQFDDDMISVGASGLKILGEVHLGKEIFPLIRFYVRSKANDRSSSRSYSPVNYQLFRDSFKALYLQSDEAGMPVFVHYGTNRAVLKVPTQSRKDQKYDKLSALDHAIDQELDFESFFSWYRDQEANEIIDARERKDFRYTASSLHWVRAAIEGMIGNVTNLRIRRNPTRMVADKDGRELRVDRFSDGEKCTLALFGDLARRLILANPEAENPLEGEGIVLIDEVDLHMHPSWQRKILYQLRTTFPHIQFIITTHSPQVLGEAGNEYQIFGIRTDENGDAVIQPIPRMNGYDSNMILEEFMGTESSSCEKRNLVAQINEAIADGQFVMAEKGLETLKELSGPDDAEYILASEYLKRSKRIHA